MKVLYSIMEKETISKMEAVDFSGRIITIQTEKDTDKAVSYLSAFRNLGLDTETRPSFKKGETHKVALLQLSTEDTCFLFRLNYIGMPDSLLRLLSDPHILKIGLSLRDDLQALKSRGLFDMLNFLDLQDYVSNFGIKDRSLKKIYANLFGQRISKRQQRSNWEAETLTEQQKKYAAIDAWACLQIYNTLRQLAPKDYRLVEVKPKTSEHKSSN